MSETTVYYDAAVPTPAPHSLSELREEWADARVKYEAAVALERISRLAIETQVIAAAGGDHKSLGPNEKDRERVFLLAVEADEGHKIVQAAVSRAWLSWVMAVAKLEAFYITVGQPLPYISPMEPWH